MKEEMKAAKESGKSEPAESKNVSLKQQNKKVEAKPEPAPKPKRVEPKVLPKVEIAELKSDKESKKDDHIEK